MTLLVASKWFLSRRKLSYKNLSLSPIYHYQKIFKKIILWRKINWRSWTLLKVFEVFLRVLSDRLFFRVPINRFFSWVISALFCTCRYFCATTFLLKTDVLFYIIFSRRSSHLTISLMQFNNFNKTYSDW